MSSEPSTPVKPVLPFTRFAFWVAVVLASVAGFQLTVLTKHTDHYFAWTIGNPLSATFLGSIYFSGTVLFVLSLRERAWANVRVAMAPILTFVPLITLATFLHLQPFHFHSSILGARIAAWAWLVVYILDPILVVVAVVLQLRIAGDDPPVLNPVAPWARAVVGINGVGTFIVGLALFVVPHRLFGYWPWQLTTLTAQTTACGFLAIAAASIFFVRERSWARARVGTLPFLTMSLLQLLGLLRYEGRVEWGRAATWLYLVFLLAIVAGSVYSSLLVWRMGPEESLPVVAIPHGT